MARQGLILAGHDVSSGGLLVTLLEMCFPNLNGGVEIALDALPSEDTLRLMFSEQPAIIIQTKKSEDIPARLKDQGVNCYRIGKVLDERHLKVSHRHREWIFDIDHYRDLWFETSYHFEKKQSKPELALQRFQHYRKQPLRFVFPSHFTGRLMDFGIGHGPRKASGIRSAIIREKGVNGDREMAYAMYLAGLDVKDIHMTDLISGRENLEDVHLIVFVGGFSNSDVLGSAKGWAGAFMYNKKAKTALDNFYRREDTLSLGVCNGCQLMMELNLIHEQPDQHPKMLHNTSGKFESAFLTVAVEDNQSVMLGSLSGSQLGIWVAHGEGRFDFPSAITNYQVAARYCYDTYPGNPNGSPEAIAAIYSSDGRHLAMMPHLERAFLPWQWAHYPSDRKDEVSPWIEAFVNARNWIKK